MGREQRSDKRVRGTESRRRVTMHLLQLAWLEGFPVEDGWHRLDTGERITLDGARISRTRRAAHTAIREHREALATMVGDVDRWWAVVDAALRWCSAPRGALDLLEHAPRRIVMQARALASRPGLGDAAIAAGVAWATRPQRLGHAIAWLAGLDAIVDDVVTTLALAQLAEHSPDGVAAWIALAAIDAPDPKTAMERVTHLERRVRDGKVQPSTPGPRSGHHVRAWLSQLRRWPPDVQRRALAVLAVAGAAEGLAPWGRWERSNADRIARVVAFAEREFDWDGEARNVAGITRVLYKVRDNVPWAIAIDEVLVEIERLASERLVAFQAPVVRLLAALLSEEAGCRPLMLVHLTRCAATADHPRVAWLWHALAAALTTGASPHLLDPWRDAIDDTNRSHLDDELVESLARRSDIERLVTALGSLAQRGPVSRDDAVNAATWIAVGVPASLTCEIVVALRKANDRWEISTARMVVALAEGATDDIVALAPAVFAITSALDYREALNLGRLVEHAARSGAAWLARAAFVANQGKALVEAACILPALPRASWPALAVARRPSWIDRYPAALTAVLHRLAAVDSEAERTAARRLAADLPKPADLLREVTALRGKAHRTIAQDKRLASLERRLVAPRLPSPARLARLADKLERATVTIGLARFTVQANAAATERMERTFGANLPQPLDRRTQEIVLGLLSLDEPDRVLAGRLLRVRTGPRPWDLRDDPANATFLAAMHDAGVDPTPWLDSTPSAVTAADGTLLELALCSDPLEVFAMGAHFQTCLSPDGGNFFSVLANAADINKRVLYARQDGRVIGRCLLAITEGFALLTFNPYCHDGALDFATCVRGFALDLAARMKTCVVALGEVRRLVARDWYDDGPRDLVGRFRALDESALDLAHADPSTVVDRLRTSLGHELDDVTLPIVLGLHSLQRRPELVAQLAPFVMAARSPLVHRISAALALDAGERALAARLLGDHGDLIGNEHYAWPTGKLLALLHPVRALAQLRASRRRGVRGWRDESGDRIAVAAVAMEALHRPRKAAELYRLASEREPHLAKELAPRLAALASLEITGT